MSIFRQFVLPIYRWSTRSKRAELARRFEVTQQWPAAILFYHRVSNQFPNPWSMNRNCFREQLDLIDTIGTFASIDEIRQEQLDGTRDHLKIAITFDDGYSENMDWAIPELVLRNIPCTYFVATDYIENAEPFPHDLQRGRPLTPNTKAEIREMANLGIQIGGHTRSHLDLGQEWPTERLRSELCDSRKKLQDWTGQSIDYFSFPFGLSNNISQSAIDMVAQAGYKAFASAIGGWNFPGSDEFHLPRFHGDPCTEALRNWLTLDPRKIRQRCVLPYKKPTFSDDSQAEIQQIKNAKLFPLNASFPAASVPMQSVQ